MYRVISPSSLDIRFFYFRKLEMELLAMVFYVPTPSALTEVDNIARYLRNGFLPNIHLRKIRSKGLREDVAPNFILLTAGDTQYVLLNRFHLELNSFFQGRFSVCKHQGVFKVFFSCMFCLIYKYLINFPWINQI